MIIERTGEGLKNGRKREKEKKKKAEEKEHKENERLED